MGEFFLQMYQITGQYVTVNLILVNFVKKAVCHIQLKILMIVHDSG